MTKYVAFFILRSVRFERRTERWPEPIVQAIASGLPDGHGHGSNVVEAGVLGVVACESHSAPWQQRRQM